jgi:DNA-binding NtrC family response regulator
MSMPILDHLTKQQQDMQQGIGSGEAPGADALQNVPVLLVEDDPDTAWDITNELTRRGYLVRVAETEVEGLVAARRDHAALLIVDRMLKGVDSLSMIETALSRCQIEHVTDLLVRRLTLQRRLRSMSASPTP